MILGTLARVSATPVNSKTSRSVLRSSVLTTGIKLALGQDNESTLCTTGAVPNVFAGNETDHDGPYGGVLLGFYASATCTVAEP